MKFEPVSVNRNAPLPAVTKEGLIDASDGTGLEAGSITNSADPEFPPPGDGLMTLTAAEPELAMSAAVICACNCVLEEKVATRVLLFHCTVDDGKKFSPVIVKVKAPAPAVPEFGLSETMEGVGFGGGGGGPPPEFPEPLPLQPDKNRSEKRHASARIQERALTRRRCVLIPSASCIFDTEIRM